MRESVVSSQKSEDEPGVPELGGTALYSTRRLPPAIFGMLLSACCLLPAGFGLAQQPALPPPAQQPAPPAAPAAGSETEETPLPGDWAPELLDAILSSPNEQASEALYRAAFAAGPRVIPPLEAALRDDRTAEFAAQSLAFIGGDKALGILQKLVTDPRDLNLRRFYYGALGEFDSPEATDVLFEVINKSEAEADRTVTEAAVLALTVRSDLKLLPRMREAEDKLRDVVIRDDLDNARAVIEGRAKYLASPEGKKTGGSVEDAVRTYFIPALALPPPPPASKVPTRGAPEKPQVKVEIRNLTLSPDKTRALAQVTFEDSSALAQYDIVLQKRSGDWTVASAWLGPEHEKPEPNPARAPPRQN